MLNGQYSILTTSFILFIYFKTLIEFFSDCLVSIDALVHKVIIFTRKHKKLLF